MCLKNIFKLTFINILFCFSLSGIENYQEIFLRANKFYKEGNFQDAYDNYKKIPNKSAYVNYNLGNCAYKLNQKGYALLFWRRAEKDWGFLNRGELLGNIELLKQSVSGSKTKNKFFETFANIKKYSFSLLRSAPLFGVQLLFLFLWILSFLFIRFLYKRKKRVLIVILFMFMACLGGLLIVRYGLDFKHYGIVVSKEANLLSGPGSSFQKLGTLPETSQVRIQRESDNFYKIQLGKQVGWVRQTFVEKI